jgi:hypothetical protein
LRTATPHHLDHEISYYKQFFPQNAQRAFTIRPEIAHTTQTRFETITHNFKELLWTNKRRYLEISVVSVSEASTPEVLRENETRMGGFSEQIEYVVTGSAQYFELPKINKDRIQEACGWLKSAFGIWPMQDSYWEWSYISPLQMRPFDTGFEPTSDELNTDRVPHYIPEGRSANDTDFGHCWIHFSSNDEEKMAVCGM